VLFKHIDEIAKEKDTHAINFFGRLNRRLQSGGNKDAKFKNIKL